MRIFMLVFGLAMFGLTLSAAPVTVYVHDYPPYYNADGEGYVVNIIKDAFAAGGVDVKIGVLPINRAVKSLTEGTIDAFSPGKVFVPKESLDLILSQDYFVVTVCVFYQGNTLSSLDDLKGKKIGIIKGSVIKDVCVAKGIVVEEVEDADTIAKMFVQKRIDAAELAYPTALLLFQKYMPDNKLKVKYLTEVNLPCAVSVPKKNAALLSAFTKGLQTIVANGKYLQDIEAFYGKGNVPAFELLPDLKITGGAKTFSLDRFYAEKRNGIGLISK